MVVIVLYRYNEQELNHSEVIFSCPSMDQRIISYLGALQSLSPLTPMPSETLHQLSLV